MFLPVNLSFQQWHLWAHSTSLQCHLLAKDPMCSTLFPHQHPTSHPSSTAASIPGSGAYQVEPSRTDQKLIDPSPSSKANWQQQQQRQWQWQLLLLGHAFLCKREPGQCPLMHCKRMKRLWEHNAHCHNQQCEEQHCTNSRNVLIHVVHAKTKNAWYVDLCISSCYCLF